MKSLANEISKLARVYTFILIKYHSLFFSRINRGNQRKETRGLKLIQLVKSDLKQVHLFTVDWNN